MKAPVITGDMLREACACDSYLRRFDALHPSGRAKITVNGAVRQAREWDWDWAADAFLTDEVLRDKYEDLNSEAYAKLRKKVLGERDNKKIAKAGRRYRERQAEAFARMYRKQERRV